MRNLLAFFAALLIGFLGLGWYLDWYNFSAKPNSDGTVGFNGSVDTKKVVSDVKKGAKAAHDALGRVGDEDTAKDAKDTKDAKESKEKEPAVNKASR